MKHSIKRQLGTLCIGLVLFMFIAFLFINSTFLEQYYVANKQKAFTNIYQVMNQKSEKNNLASEDTTDLLTRLAEKGNISLAVANSDGTLVISSSHEKDILQGQMIGYLIGQNQNSGELLEETKQYQIRKQTDPRNKSEYIEMWGKLNSSQYFILRSPLESIRESVKISNQFLIYVGCAVILISFIAVLYFSRKIVNPILELAILSKKMADLDFEAKYASGGENEIGILGENFNTMSSKLEAAISGLKNANYELQKDIERKDKIETMRTEFLGNVSHELKTPIALIQGYAEGLKEGINEDKESKDFYCDVIMDEAAKMNQLVKNLMTLNQLEYRSDDVEFDRFDITDLIQGVLQSSDILVRQKEAKIHFQAAEQVFVWADEFKVEQVVRNYVTNAIHHVDGEKVIDIKSVKHDDKIRISVFNTGAPIPEEDLEHIWDKFYKVDKARTREYGGNGIGLSIVKAIMDSFHQEYGAKNYENGVEFWFELDIK